MTPYRTQTLSGYALGSIKGLVAAPVETSAAVGAGAAAALGWAFGSANVALLWIVGLAMLLDLVVGSLHAGINPLEEFSIQKLYGGFVGKLFRSLLVPTASLIDWLYIKSPLPLPEGYGEAFPVTALAMVGLAAAELTSILRHFKDGGVAPSLIATIIRHLDRIRMGQEPPVRRHYDAPAIEARHEQEIDPPPDPRS